MSKSWQKIQTNDLILTGEVAEKLHFLFQGTTTQPEGSSCLKTRKLSKKLFPISQHVVKPEGTLRLQQWLMHDHSHTQLFIAGGKATAPGRTPRSPGHFYLQLRSTAWTPQGIRKNLTALLSKQSQDTKLQQKLRTRSVFFPFTVTNEPFPFVELIIPTVQ